ncbi:hypothetical protein [Caballeronia novacaledonica]|uniref:Uncharacterized protein n=1 Tax=Caballeronia novacaledonica TaxID=1544861 RepID=A0AA37IG92_9BURK|nr:hypothetical protein [Caballeronia novacaledonica]GJH28793.1 hypothetical protein CBA19CS42_29775 [Caballeronia novacaledonica]
MFSGLSKLADKSFVLGFLLPALIGVISFLALNRDLKSFSALFKDTMHDKGIADVTLLLLFVWTVAVLLMAGSHWMYRVLEGYAWPLTHPRLLKLQIARRQSQRQEIRNVYTALSEVHPALDELCRLSQENRLNRQRLLDQLNRKYLRLTRLHALQYPEEPSLVLPTRFGNVLRSFEMYAGTVYGVESIHTWPRLLAVIPKEYQSILADARAPVDFFVSLVFISFALGVTALMRGAACLFNAQADSAATWTFTIVAAIIFAFVRLFYLAALPSAVAWGETVKSAFDMYLPALASALGYELPETLEERRRFWDALANQFLYHEAIQPELWLKITKSPLKAGRPAKETAPAENGDEENDAADGAASDHGGAQIGPR